MSDDTQPEPRDLFGEKPADAPRMPLRDKRDELRREVNVRRSVYPRLVADGKLGQLTADRQLALMESILADYEIEPWPQTRNFVAHWRPKAETLTVIGARATRMHRDELLAVLAFCVDVMKKAGILPGAEPPK